MIDGSIAGGIVTVSGCLFLMILLTQVLKKRGAKTTVSSPENLG